MLPDSKRNNDVQPAGEGHSRREFLFKLMASGFALSVQPVMASVIHTSAAGLEAGPVMIDVGQGEAHGMPAYAARPAHARGALPVVLVVQEVFGVHEHIQDICRRLAHLGYLAVAPELYFRQGDPRQYPELQDLITHIVSKVPDQQVMSDMDATVQWAGSHGGDLQRMGMTGFCWGGRIVWLYTARNPLLKASVAWYGPLVGTPSALTPRFPVDIAGELKAPVLGLYGGLDPSIKAEHVAQMRAALAAVHSPSEIIVYPQAGHGFNADYRSSYNEPAAKDGWVRMLAWFHKYGVQ
jgi:carboxymethylenebutenolidase